MTDVKEATRLPVGSNPAAAHAALTRISDLVEKALKGELARDREPHYWEPSILSPAHINMVLDRAAGFGLKEIAERWDYTAVQVANVLSHPDAQLIISTILSLQAGSLVSMEDRFKALSHEALNVKVEMMRDPAVHPSVRNTIATDVLDRAGYMPRKQVELKAEHKILLPAQAATGLREILAESKRVATMDYSNFLQKPGAEIAAEHLQIESGPLDTGNGPSPVPAQVSGDPLEEVA